jgi:hypothetical protein
MKQQAQQKLIIGIFLHLLHLFAKNEKTPYQPTRPT